MAIADRSSQIRSFLKTSDPARCGASQAKRKVSGNSSRIRTADWLILGIGAALYISIQVVFANAHRHDNDFKHIYLGMQALTEREEPYSLASLRLQAGEQSFSPNTGLNPYVYL